MEKWSELSKDIKIGIVILIILVIVIAATTENGNQKGTQQIESFSTMEVKPSEASTSVSKWDAYGICTQVAKDKYGIADFGLDEATDMGDGDWIIVGHADIPGKRIHWTGEVKHDPKDDKWQIKGWTDR
jgi:hypothetical protein